MTRAGSGLSVGGDPVEVALEAAIAAQDASGADGADLALVFLTPGAHDAAHEALAAIRRVTRARVVLGCSGVGVLTERMEFEAHAAAAEATVAAAVLVVASDAIRVSPFLDEGREGLGAAVGARVAGGPMRGGPAVAVVLPDPVGLDPGGLLDGVARAAAGARVLGGVASGPPCFELCDAAVASGALAGCWLEGGDPVVGVAQGCEPIGEPFVVTRGAGGVIEQIAGRPALSVLEDALATGDVMERARAAGLFAGLAMDPGKSPLGRGDFLVRALVGGDRDSGALQVAAPVRVGQTVQFQLRDARAAADDLEHTLAGMVAALGGRPPAFGCYFNCAGRGQGLYGTADHDIGRIHARLGSFPLVGFFGNGEFAPVGGRNFFHTYTGVLLVYPEPGAHATA